MKLGYLLFLFLFASSFASASTTNHTARLAGIEQRLARLERHASPSVRIGTPLFLFGAFCALWAQNTGRNSWLWFFLGALFSIITIFFLLTKNASDLQRRRLRARLQPAK